MHAEVKLFLLKIVKFNGNLTPLVKMGYEYSQIIQLLDELIADGLLTKANNKVMATETGLLEIDNLNKQLSRRDSSLWIEPDTASRITKINKNDVFLPDQDELSF
mgnify:CR=1 FL=1